MTKRQKFFSALGRYVKDFFTKNIILKIVVLLFSVLLWGFVIAEENPEYTKRIYDVEIELRGEESLLSKGWMLVDRGAPSTDVDVKCEINKHRLLDASRLDCYIDLTRIASASTLDDDTITMPFDVKCEVASDFGTLDSTTVERVEVTLAKTQTLNNQTVEVNTVGELPDNLIAEVPSNVTIASLTGQQSQISKIGKMKVFVDLSEFSNTEPGIYDVNLPVRFYERGATDPFDFATSNGEPVTTGVRIKIRACKELPITVKVVPSEEFENRFDWQVRIVNAETIKLCADRREVLDKVESIETEQIVPRMAETEEIKSVSLILPDGAMLLNGSTKATASIILSVTEKESSLEFRVPIRYSQTKDSVALSGSERKSVTIRVTGTYTAINHINTSWFTASVDVSNYQQGTYQLPIRILFEGDSAEYRFELLDPEDGYVEIVLEEIRLPEPSSEPVEPKQTVD